MSVGHARFGVALGGVKPRVVGWKLFCGFVGNDLKRSVEKLFDCSLVPISALVAVWMTSMLEIKKEFVGCLQAESCDLVAGLVLVRVCAILLGGAVRSFCALLA